jgi:hypothetical protein
MLDRDKHSGFLSDSVNDEETLTQFLFFANTSFSKLPRWFVPKKYFQPNLILAG